MTFKNVDIIEDTRVFDLSLDNIDMSLIIDGDVGNSSVLEYVNFQYSVVQVENYVRTVIEVQPMELCSLDRFKNDSLFQYYQSLTQSIYCSSTINVSLANTFISQNATYVELGIYNCQ